MTTHLQSKTLPLVLAWPWQQYEEETHPAWRLKLMIDAVEVAVRWSVAVGLGEVRHRMPDGAADRLPADLQRQLQQHVRQPSFGDWLAMLKHVEDWLRRQQPTPKSLLAPGLLGLYSKVIHPSCSRDSGRDAARNSLLALRNVWVHAGPHSMSWARERLADHESRAAGVMAAVGRMLDGDVEVHGEWRGRTYALHEAAAREVEVTDRPSTTEGGVWLVRRRESAVERRPLLPLVAFGAVERLAWDNAPLRDGERERHADSPAYAQVYWRAESRALRMMILGAGVSDGERQDVELFEGLFGPLLPRGASSTGEYRWDYALNEARRLAPLLIGRVQVLKKLKSWIRETERGTIGSRVGWFSGAPGSGKSLLMARLAAELANGKPDRHGLYYHRFQRGDQQNSRRAFLQQLQQALLNWVPLIGVAPPPNRSEMSGTALEADVLERLSQIADLPLSAGATPRTFRVLIDGLDEVIDAEPSLPALIHRLAVAGTVFLVAGQSVPGLFSAFATPESAHPLPQGLPRLADSDVRAMLLERTQQFRSTALIRRDAYDRDGNYVGNAFIDRVVRHAAGLPLYVQYVVEDLVAGRISENDEAKLPSGLDAYYRRLFAGLAATDVQRDRVLLAAVLSMIAEPLDAQGIAIVLGPGAADFEAPLSECSPAHVHAVLDAGQSLWESVALSDAGVGVRLRHDSLRAFIAETPALAATREDAQRRLVRVAARWAETPIGTQVRAHFLRSGSAYTCAWGNETRKQALFQQWTSFTYWQARTAELPMRDLEGLLSDVVTVGQMPGAPQSLGVWAAWLRDRIPMLRRGTPEWPANRILLQLAVEHADDSPVMQAAEAWLAAGACTWTWMRRSDRAASWRSSGAETHTVPWTIIGETTKPVRQLVDIGRNRVLSRDDDAVVVWDLEGALPPRTLGRFTSVKVDREGDQCRTFAAEYCGTVTMWDAESLNPLSQRRIDRETVAFRYIGDGLVACWQYRGHGICFLTARGEVVEHRGRRLSMIGANIVDAFGLPDDRVAVLRRNSCEIVNLRDVSIEPVFVSPAHIQGGVQLRQGALVWWGDDLVLRVANPELADRADCREVVALKGWWPEVLALSDALLVALDDEKAMVVDVSSAQVYAVELGRPSSDPHLDGAGGVRAIGRLCDLERWDFRARRKTGHYSAPREIAHHCHTQLTGDVFVATKGSATIAVLDQITLEQRLEYSAHRAPICAIAALESGVVVSAAEDGTLICTQNPLVSAQRLDSRQVAPAIKEIKCNGECAVVVTEASIRLVDIQASQSVTSLLPPEWAADSLSQSWYPIDATTVLRFDRGAEALATYRVTGESTMQTLWSRTARGYKVLSRRELVVKENEYSLAIVEAMNGQTLATFTSPEKVGGFWCIGSDLLLVLDQTLVLHLLRAADASAIAAWRIGDTETVDVYRLNEAMFCVSTDDGLAVMNTSGQVVCERLRVEAEDVRGLHSRLQDGEKFAFDHTGSAFLVSEDQRVRDWVGTSAEKLLVTSAGKGILYRTWFVGGGEAILEVHALGLSAEGIYKTGERSLHVIPEGLVFGFVPMRKGTFVGYDNVAAMVLAPDNISMETIPVGDALLLDFGDERISIHSLDRGSLHVNGASAALAIGGRIRTVDRRTSLRQQWHSDTLQTHAISIGSDGTVLVVVGDELVQLRRVDPPE